MHIDETISAFKVGDWTVRPAELSVAGEAIAHTLEAKVMDVLLVLAADAGEVVSRDTLIDKVWGTEFGGDESLTRAISLLRKALGDTRGNHNHILTVPRRGYQLIASVGPIDLERSALPVQEPSAPSPAITPEHSTAAPASGSSRASWPAPITILAFGAVAFIAVLFGASWLFSPSGPDRVTASAKLFDPGYYLVERVVTAQDDPDLEAVARSLSRDVVKYMSDAGLKVGVRVEGDDTQSPEFVLQGVVHQDDVQFTLTRWDGGAPLWTETLGNEGASIESIAGFASIRPASIASCIEDIRRMDETANKDVMRLVAQFCAAIHDSRFFVLAELAENILDQAPGSIIGEALGVYGYGSLIWHGRETTEDQNKSRQRLEELYARVLARDPENPAAKLGRTMSFRFDDPQRMLNELETGYRASLFDSQRLFFLGMALRVVGQNEQAIDAMRRASANPHHVPNALYFASYMEHVFGRPFAEMSEIDAAEEQLGISNTYGGFKFQIFLYYKPVEEAQEYLEDVEFPNQRTKDCMIAFIRARSGELSSNVQVLDRCESALGPSALHRIYVQLGMLDEAFEASIRVLEVQDLRSFWPTHFHFPEYAAFRADPRFWEVSEKYDMLGLWLASGRWPDWCFEPDLGYDCETRARAYKAGTLQVE